MTTIVPYTIYSIPFFNFVQILTQIFTKKCDSHFAPAAAILYKGGVFARYFYLQHLAKKFMNKTKFLLYTYIIFQTQFLSKEKLKKKETASKRSLFFLFTSYREHNNPLQILSHPYHRRNQQVPAQ